MQFTGASRNEKRASHRHRGAGPACWALRARRSRRSSRWPRAAGSAAHAQSRRSGRFHRLLGLRRHARTGAGACSLPSRATSPASPSTPKDASSATPGIPPPMKPPATQCKAYGAPAIMRVPGRLHITWADDNTLQIDTDAGTQTRLLHFNGKPSGEPSLARLHRRQLGAAPARVGRAAIRTGSHARGHARPVARKRSPRSCAPATCARTALPTAPTPSSRSTSTFPRSATATPGSP